MRLILLPGMDGTGDLFAPFIAALGNAFPVTVVRYPAAGGSQTYADLTEVATQSLPTQGRLVLLGESFSGPIAIALAAAHPTRVVGVVLCCTFVRNPRPGLVWLSGLAKLTVPLPPRAVLSTVLLGRFATPRLRLLLQEALAQVRPAALRARLREVVAVDVRALARTLSVPALYLQANSDRLVPQRAVAEAVQCCNHVTVQSFDAPHCLLQAVPVQAAAVVSDFVARVGVGASP